MLRVLEPPRLCLPRIDDDWNLRLTQLASYDPSFGATVDHQTNIVFLSEIQRVEDIAGLMCLHDHWDFALECPRKLQRDLREVRSILFLTTRQDSGHSFLHSARLERPFLMYPKGSLASPPRACAARGPTFANNAATGLNLGRSSKRPVRTASSARYPIRSHHVVPRRHERHLLYG